MTARPTSHFLLHASLICVVLLVLAFWHRSVLNIWTPQLLATLTIAYVLFNVLVLRKWTVTHESRAITIESLVALVVTVELVELTGGLSGAFGFLAYLLVVWLSLQLEKPIAIVTGIGLLLFFFPGTSLYPVKLLMSRLNENPQALLSDAVRLLGLLLTIPLALYISKRQRHQQHKI